MRIPTFEEAVAIAEGNDEFYRKTHITSRDITIEHFGYKLPGLMDFTHPLGDRSDVDAFEIRGISYIDGYHHLMLRKFFALNQTKGFMLDDLKDNKIRYAQDKVDGSIVRFLPHGENVMAKTKNAFDGFHCEIANKIVQNSPELKKEIRLSIDAGMAMIFELVSPENKVVLDYGDNVELRLIQVRDEITGEYFDIREFENPVLNPASFVRDIKTWDDVQKFQKNTKNVEGVVLTLDNGMLVKAKTVWYEDMHDCVWEGNRTNRKLLEMCVNDTIDDAVSMLEPSDPDRGMIEDVYRSVAQYVSEAEKNIAEIVSHYDGDNKKFAGQYKKHPHFSLMMRHVKNGDNIRPMVLDYIRSNTKNEDTASKFVNNLN